MQTNPLLKEVFWQEKLSQEKGVTRLIWWYDVKSPSASALWKRAAFWSGQYLAGCPIHWQLFIYRLGKNRLHVHILIAFQWSDMLYLSWKEELNHAVNRVIQLILIMCMLLPQHMNSCYSENELGLDCDAFQSWEIFLTLCANIWHLQNNRWISQNMRRLLASFDRGIKLLIVWQSGLDLLVSSHLARFIDISVTFSGSCYSRKVSKAKIVVTIPNEKH